MSEEKKIQEQEVKESLFYNGKLYGVYSVVSNKTVREHEKFYIAWKNHDKMIPGEIMERTNRGYFIDGYNIDEKSVNIWFSWTKKDRDFIPKKHNK